MSPSRRFSSDLTICASFSNERHRMVGGFALTVVGYIADDDPLIRGRRDVHFIDADAEPDKDFTFFKYGKVFPRHRILIYDNGVAVHSLHADLFRSTAGGEKYPRRLRQVSFFQFQGQATKYPLRTPYT